MLVTVDRPSPEWTTDDEPADCDDGWVSDPPTIWKAD